MNNLNRNVRFQSFNKNNKAQNIIKIYTVKFHLKNLYINTN